MKTIFAFLSVALGLALATQGIFYAFEVGPLSPENQRAMGSVGLLAMVIAFAVVGAFIMLMSWALMLAGVVALRRGAAYLAWVLPNECRTLYHWVFTTWDFYDHKGRQEGVRVFGLEVSLQGFLRS